MPVITEIENRVATIVLDWPERGNALGPDEARELAGALESVGTDPDVSAVILTGNGPFCGGGDLRAVLSAAAEGAAAVRELLYGAYHALIRTMVRLPRPLLAAVDGPAVGLGMDLALACDWRAVGPGGSLRQGWAELGAIPGTGGELLLRRLAPGLLWSLLGEPRTMGAAEADALDLAESAPVTALERATEHARGLTALPIPMLEGYVRLHRAELIPRLEEHLAICAELQPQLVASEEFRRRAGRVIGGV